MTYDVPTRRECFFLKNVSRIIITVLTLFKSIFL